MAIDGEVVLCYCKDCGTWEVTESKDLYLSKDASKEFDYPFHRELINSKEYELGLESPVVCKNCGQPMKKLYEDDFGSGFDLEQEKEPINVKSVDINNTYSLIQYSKITN